MLKKIAISPESSNYNDNDENVAYLYRGYIIWKYTNDFGSRSGRSDEWHYGPAVFHAPNAALGETFEPYWDDADGRPQCRETRKDCIACIDRLYEQGLAVINPGYDPDDAKTVTLAVSLNEARTILAALSRRVYELELDGPRSAGLAVEARAIYQSIDQQTFHPANS